MDELIAAVDPDARKAAAGLLLGTHPDSHRVASLVYASLAERAARTLTLQAADILTAAARMAREDARPWDITGQEV